MPTVRMHPMFNNGHRKGGKALMKILFEVPHDRSMSDEEFMECQSFVIGTMAGCDWPTDNLADEMSLRDLIKKSYIGTRELAGGGEQGESGGRRGDNIPVQEEPTPVQERAVHTGGGGVESRRPDRVSGSKVNNFESGLWW